MRSASSRRSAYFYLGVIDQLGADPMKTLEHELGRVGAALPDRRPRVTPLRQLIGINLLRYRRAIGLLAFYYAVLHLTTYLVLDQGLDWAAIWADIVKRPYITIGMASFVLLVPLAATSNNASIRRLGGQAWARLHKLVYIAAAWGGALRAAREVLAPGAAGLCGLVAALLGYRLVKTLFGHGSKTTSRDGRLPSPSL